MPSFPADPPWCTGRVYANAPAELKVWCLRRPPPYWWIVHFEGFTTHGATLNANHLLRPDRYATGKNPFGFWKKTLPEIGGFTIEVMFQQNFANPQKRQLRVLLNNPPTFSQSINWGFMLLDPIEDWVTEWDHKDMPEIHREPTYSLGDATCQVRIGTYDRIPAHSCRGDYTGEWP